MQIVMNRRVQERFRHDDGTVVSMMNSKDTGKETQGMMMMTIMLMMERHVQGSPKHDVDDDVEMYVFTLIVRITIMILSS